MSDFPSTTDVCLGLFFTALVLSQFGLMLLSILAQDQEKRERYLEMGGDLLEPTRMPPVALIVPSFNEGATIADSIRALTQIDYPALEIVVVNDGSKDDTLKVLKQAFDLRRSEFASEGRLAHAQINDTYRSRRFPQIFVVDKANGGKADALNAGIEHTLCPLVCCIDADTIIDRQSLTRLVEPFLTMYPPPVAVGGTIQIANDSDFSNGQLVQRRLPRRGIARSQALEYMRAFLFFRLPLARRNANLIISGALGLFRRETVLDVGGYSVDTVGEDMELVVRMHAHCARLGQPYRVHFRADAVAYTECPEDFATLLRQRDRWQRGLLQTVVRHRALTFSRRAPTIGWLVLPYFWIFEVLGPFVELFALAWTLWSAISGRIPSSLLLLTVAIALLLNLVFSLHTVLLDDRDRNLVSGWDKLRLMVTGLVEPIAHRPIVTWGRLVGTWKFLRGDGSWGKMERKGFKAEGAP